MLVTLRAYDTLGLIHNIEYMIDPIVEAYGVILISVASYVFGDTNFKRVILLDMGMYPLLDCSMLNLFSILSMNVDYERLSNL